jgi:hypothetical protein
MEGRNPILAAMRLVIALLLLLALPSTAAAADLTMELDPPDGVRYGEATEIEGTLTEGETPLAGQVVVLEAREFPYQGGFEQVEQSTTGSDGRYRFEREFDRNVQLRVRAPGAQAASEVVAAHVFPRVRLTFSVINERRIRLTQTYRVPRNVRLSQKTLFYVGPRSDRTAPVTATSETRRVRRGRYRATAVVRLRRAWRGRFQYASCFRYSEGSGLGDPKSRCPRRYRF